MATLLDADVLRSPGNVAAVLNALAPSVEVVPRGRFPHLDPLATDADLNAREADSDSAALLATAASPSENKADGDGTNRAAVAAVEAAGSTRRRATDSKRAEAKIEAVGSALPVVTAAATAVDEKSVDPALAIDEKQYRCLLAEQLNSRGVEEALRMCRWSTLVSLRSNKVHFWSFAVI